MLRSLRLTGWRSDLGIVTLGLDALDGARLLAMNDNAACGDDARLAQCG
jgi:hypothetical protein